MAIDKREKKSKSRRVAVSSTLFANDFCHDASTKARKQRSLKKCRRHATRRDPLNDSKLRNIVNQSPPCHKDARVRTGLSCSSPYSSLENILNLSWKLPGDPIPFVHQKLHPLLDRSSHFEYALSYSKGPHIPENWKVFQTVDWTSSIKPLASSNSSTSPLSDLNGDKIVLPKSISNSSRASSSQGPSPIKAGPQSCPKSTDEAGSPINCKSTSQADPIAIILRKGNILDARTRNQWNFMATMQPAQSQWRRQTSRRALRRDRLRHAGYLDLNQSARNEDLWPQVAGPSFLSFNNTSMILLLQFAYEQSWSCIIGRRLVDLVQTEAFPAHYRHVTQWPPRISAIGPLPTVDYICRATPKAMGWHEDMCPVLFVAHPFPFSINDSWRHTRPVTSKLANVFQPMISLFILYYLDTRATLDEPLPHWMILFGATYSESEVEIWAHYPWLLGESGEDGREEEWCALSQKTASYQFCKWHGLPTERGVLFGALNRIQGHCSYVLNQLKAWDGYERACKLLSL
ncbi:hypothetical protein M408DRAFT_103882 [Serendipita vermifera MAFF 305830]|uniref:Uncharacterized protein n=1 Tax=Serendipita vermifera MAFF 305830 TaxID=933852 RepID=A0A0C3AQD7_SERVB|nr:hypothetical protein M408DRAFT_103882 [Serendipita vermifera MAFF 305830]